MKKQIPLDEKVLEQAQNKEHARQLFEKDPLLIQKVYWTMEILKFVHIEHLDLLQPEEVSALPYVQDQVRKLQTQSAKSAAYPHYGVYSLDELQKMPASTLEGTNSARIVIAVAQWCKKHPGRVVEPDATMRAQLKVIQEFGKLIEQKIMTPDKVKAALRGEPVFTLEQLQVLSQVNCKLYWGEHEPVRKALKPYIVPFQKRYADENTAGQLPLIDPPVLNRRPKTDAVAEEQQNKAKEVVSIKSLKA